MIARKIAQRGLHGEVTVTELGTDAKNVAKTEEIKVVESLEDMDSLLVAPAEGGAPERISYAKLTEQLKLKNKADLDEGGKVPTNQLPDGIETKVLPRILVSTETGSVVTCSCGEMSLTAEAVEGLAVINLPDYGDWTVSAQLGDLSTNVETVHVDTVKKIELELYYTRVYGVCWDYAAESTALSRLDRSNDPQGYVNTAISAEPVAAVGSGEGSSPFDSIYPWSDMEEFNIIDNEVKYKRGDEGFSRSEHDTMVWIPVFYVAVVDDTVNSKRYFYLSDHAREGFVRHPGSGKYVGRYDTIEGHYSKTGAAPIQNMTCSAYISAAQKKGNMWGLYGYAAWCAVWLLYLIEYADWNSQAKIGIGLMDSEASIAFSGGTDAMVYHTGRAAGEDGKTAVQYRHLENLWGNIYEFLGGLTSIEAYISAAGEHPEYNVTLTESYAIGAGYTTKLVFNEDAPWTFCPLARGGSETTYIPDWFQKNSKTDDAYLAIVGGDTAEELVGGLFRVNFYPTSSTSGDYTYRLEFSTEE